MFVMSLYDYWNNGITNELYLYVPGHETDELDHETWQPIRTPDRLFDLGDTGEHNIIATIHKATVTGGVSVRPKPMPKSSTRSAASIKANSPASKDLLQRWAISPGPAAGPFCVHRRKGPALTCRPWGGWTYSYGLGGPKAREAPVNLWVCSEGRGRKLGQEGGLWGPPKNRGFFVQKLFIIRPLTMAGSGCIVTLALEKMEC